MLIFDITNNRFNNEDEFARILGKYPNGAYLLATELQKNLITNFAPSTTYWKDDKKSKQTTLTIRRKVAGKEFVIITSLDLESMRKPMGIRKRIRNFLQIDDDTY